MSYPIKLTEIQDGLSIFLPDPDLIKSTYDYLRSNDNNTPFPFWAKIWPSSKAMIAFLKAESHWINNKRILEIGAGIGLPSLMCSHLSLEAIVTDHATEAVELLKKNIDHLQLKNVHALCADWNDSSINIKADTVLLSDLNYDPNQFESLIKMIKHFLENRSTIIIATPERITTSTFAERLQPYLKKSIIIKVEEMNQSTEILILLLEL